MKLSEIRPCDACGGRIAPAFYVARFSIAVFKPQATNQVLGLTQCWGGSLALAEVFAPTVDAVAVAMDEEDHKELMEEVFLCCDCVVRPVTLMELAEKRNEKVSAVRG